MSLLSLAWHYGSPVLIIIAGVWVLWWAIRTQVSRLPSLRASWPLLVMLPLWLGDAAVGVGRPPIERASKGALAAATLLSLAIVGWRRRRHRVREAVPPPAALPDPSTE